MGKHYDYIIAGGGAAGLSLAWKLLQSPLSSKHILIVDSDLTPKNDKTWCFWDSDSPPFEDIIHKKWKRVEIGTLGGRRTQSLSSYPYYCLRSIDFQEKILSALKSSDNVDLLESEITKLTSSSQQAILYTDGDTYIADYIFQSCFDPWAGQPDNPKYPLLQHFLGWEISLTDPHFADDTFTLMDFDETFNEGIAFIYLLPWSKQSGLIEYTIFSDQVLSEAYYEEKLSLYLNNRFDLKPIDYQIQRREFGKIPMMDRPVIPWFKPRIMNVGTMGGVTKPSTGYTFQRIQEHAEGIVKGLTDNGTPNHRTPSEWRYKAYDLWLLQIIHDHPKDALHVFNQLFENNSVDELFRFLGEETTYGQDLKIMSSVPYMPFLRAIWKTRNRIRNI